jgi:hypothetical protein
MKNLTLPLILATLSLLTSACVVRDLLPVPAGISQIHLTGNHWSPNGPGMQAMGATFGKQSPYTITVQRITDASSGQIVFDRSQTPRSLVDSVYADVVPGSYQVAYTCELSGYQGARIADLRTQPVMVSTRLKKRYNVGVLNVTNERTADFGSGVRVPAGTCVLSFVERSL